MSRRDFEDNDPYVVIEQRSTSVMPFIVGLALGAGVALLFAPRSGEETRRDLKRRALRARKLAERKASELTDSVTETYQDARRRVEEKIDDAKDAVDLKRRQVAVYTPDGSVTVLKESQRLEGGDVLPGFTLELTELFAELDRHG